MNNLRENTSVSVVIDGMAISYDCSYLPGKPTGYSFMIHGRRLDRHYRYLLVQIITAKLDQDTADARAVVDVCARFSDGNLIVKYLCTDGSP
jgi:hypothetical protein